MLQMHVAIVNSADPFMASCCSHGTVLTVASLLINACMLCLFKIAKYSCTSFRGLSYRNRVVKGDDQKRSLFVQHHDLLLLLQAYPQIYKCVCNATDVLHKMCRRRPVNISNLSSRITAGACIHLSPLLYHHCSMPTALSPITTALSPITTALSLLPFT